MKDSNSCWISILFFYKHIKEFLCYVLNSITMFHHKITFNIYTVSQNIY